MIPAPGDGFVQSLARGLAVLTCFDAEHSAMTLSEVAARADLSRATARRCLLTLVELGYARTDGRLFELTPQVLRLGTAYLSGLGLPAILQPHLEALARETGESTSAAVLDGDEIVYVARVATRAIMSVGITVGTRFPAYATSMGRVLLAALAPDELEARLGDLRIDALTPRTVRSVPALRRELDRVRRRGHAVVDQELELGLRSVAAPVRDASGSVLAAINLSTSTTRRPALPASYVVGLVASAEAISADLAHTDVVD